MFIHHFHTKRILLLIPALLLFSCNKFVEIPEPKDTVTTVKVFSTDAQATSAMAGVLSQMINGTTEFGSSTFSNKISTINGSFSADEFDAYGINALSSNSLDANFDLLSIWGTAYNAIYGANAIIEGIEASKSASLHQQIRTQLSAEAKFIRAFSYFYLVNFFGDVPMALTIDFNQTKNMPRTPVAAVYQQMISDLNDAANGLPADYSTGGGERIRANKWAAKALLARVYLFSGDNNKAIVASSEVIAQAGLYRLTGLNDVFLKNSSESIWQLQQNTQLTLGTATSEGTALLPNPLHSGITTSSLSRRLFNSFESGDLRKIAWIDSADYQSPLGGPLVRSLFPYKYKTGIYNKVVGDQAIASEYYMVLRLAEQYLIRAEANALTGQISSTVADLNIIRGRAGLPALASSLTKDQALAAVAKERRMELFAEWGHRWFDLKRTGKAQEVLSVIPAKQPWRGNYQLLYPIPKSELLRDPFLTQNPGY